MNSPDDAPVVVLLGGGIESTRLVRDFLNAGRSVVPLHVSCGLIWDACETEHVRRFLAAQESPRLRPLIEVEISLAGFLGNHWAVTGKHVPRADSTSAELEIPLRNLLLLGLAVHRLRHLPQYDLALGTTADNSYCDGNREYFDRCEAVLSLEAGHPLRILTPLIGLHKTDVIRGSDEATLAMSFPCVEPRDGRHCGVCIKCGRRKAAFREAGVADPTLYASSCGQQHDPK